MNFKVGDRFLRASYNMSMDIVYEIIKIKPNGDLVFDKQIGSNTTIPYDCILYNEFLKSKNPTKKYEFAFIIDPSKKDGYVEFLGNRLGKKIKKILAI